MGGRWGAMGGGEKEAQRTSVAPDWRRAVVAMLCVCEPALTKARRFPTATQNQSRRERAIQNSARPTAEPTAAASFLPAAPHTPCDSSSTPCQCVRFLQGPLRATLRTLIHRRHETAANQFEGHRRQGASYSPAPHAMRVRTDRAPSENRRARTRLLRAKRQRQPPRQRRGKPRNGPRERKTVSPPRGAPCRRAETRHPGTERARTPRKTRPPQPRRRKVRMPPPGSAPRPPLSSSPESFLEADPSARSSQG